MCGCNSVGNGRKNLNEKLTVEHLTHIYGQNTPFEKIALEDVSSSVSAGELVGVICHTGSGQSTLMSRLNGLLKPTAGRILLDGEDIWAKPKEIRQIRFRVGLVFQYPEYQLFEDTVEKDISFGPLNCGLKSDDIRERVYEAMHFVGLSTDLCGISPFDLSGGQKRRVAIASVIAMRPEVLVLDEPTAGLDPRSCHELLCQINEYRRETGCTVLLVTHNMDEIAREADRILVLNQGRTALYGPPSDIFSNAEELEAMGLSLPVVTTLFRRLHAAGLDVDPSIHTLDDAKCALLALYKEAKGGSNAG